MRIVTLTLAGAALLLGASAGDGPSALPLAQDSAMRKLDKWVGEWKGSGWSTSATGKRTEFTLVESVQPRARGKVLLVEGRGVATAGADSGTVTHDGLVLVYYDEKTGRYHWNGHEAGLASVDAEPSVQDGGLEWSIPAGGGAVVRFTIQFDEKRWHEVGDVSVDGKTWSRFMEMNLARQ